MIVLVGRKLSRFSPPRFVGGWIKLELLKLYKSQQGIGYGLNSIVNRLNKETSLFTVKSFDNILFNQVIIYIGGLIKYISFPLNLA